jgi:Asp-tRNA(Asn)/Glu-tRNA(Gln) amidotransferase B subunit
MTATEEISNDEMSATIRSVLTANPDAVAKYKAGDIKVIGFLIGQTMKQLGKKADPQVVQTAIRIQLQ